MGDAGVRALSMCSANLKEAKAIYENFGSDRGF
jgi:hypothetical protein